MKFTNMKITCIVLCVLGLAALATADSGFFVPKSFFNDVVEINQNQANFLKRFKRQTFSSGGVSSSSSTSSTGGGPTYFQTSHVVGGTPGLQSRFGGSDSGYSGQAVHSTGVIQNGRVVYHDTKTDKF